MLILAHRGASAYKPENTIAAFETAIEMGADFIELDIQRTVDNKLIVMHDTRFKDDTCVCDVTYESLKKSFAANGIDVPLLDEVLKKLNRRIGINIEIKNIGVLDGLLSVIEPYDKSKIFLSSFNHEYIRDIRAKAPHLKTGVLMVSRVLDPLSIISSLKTDLLIQHFEHVDKKYVDFMHKNNIKIYVWNINSPADMRSFKNMGVDGIFTDYPDVAVRIIRDR